MEKARNSSVWTEEGYELFSSEGLENPTHTGLNATHNSIPLYGKS